MLYDVTFLQYNEFFSCKLYFNLCVIDERILQKVHFLLVIRIIGIFSICIDLHDVFI